MARHDKTKKQVFKTLHIDNVSYKTLFTDKYINRKKYVEHNPKKVIAVIPGSIKKIHVKTGSKVKEGDVLLILDAMKMNNRIMSTMDGVIKKIHVKQGSIVPKDALLLEFE